MQIVNLSELDPVWNWLGNSASGMEQLNWIHCSAKSVRVPNLAPKSMLLKRAISGWQAASLMTSESTILVSHGPRMTMYGSAALALRNRRRRHLAYSFNFTELPKRRLRSLMSKAFRSVERFVCFSTMERALYADYFDIDISRIDMLLWGVRPPNTSVTSAPLINGPYVCALGSQGRDYGALLDAMRRLPAIRLVIVATPEAVAGLTVPKNVEIRCNIPLDEATNILRYSEFMVLPLKGTTIPCGHVTIVAAMHLGKGSIVSDSSGLRDYIQSGSNGVYVPVANARLLADAVEQLWGDPKKSADLGLSAKAFARAHCTEERVVEYFANYLRSGSSYGRLMNQSS